ncbi:cytochrome c biogenesis protein CcsA [Rubeoparvulum massiliense]|uniref:cytochrome c biogenesis protein CcsA n=1 Tax=Rubeoparvulum massiliense TaxID=1631346 RepID=UPI00065DEB05|nr:cytochrome c biogenesis protein CcsA [Rubeoparvulum massiliense]
MYGNNWLIDFVIFLYALSIFLYFTDLLQKNRKAKQIAFWLLTIVWVVQTLFFIVQIMEKEYFPILTLFETLYFYSWLLLTLAWLINFLWHVDFIFIFTNLIAFTVLVICWFVKPAPSLLVAEQHELISELLFLHIGMSLMSYVAFSLSAIFSFLYLLQYRRLKRKRINYRFMRLPSLDQLYHFSYYLNLLGLTLLVTGLIVGSIWATSILPLSAWVLDPKVLMSVVVTLFYSYYFYKYLQGKENGNGIRLAWWNLLSFSTIIINYIFSSTISQFHLWFPN